jgi:L-ascorbate metabolism protein UlaG (beta-lactamase superfamily)
MTALDWHDSSPLSNGLTLTVVPAQHWSRRGFNDISRDLWGGCYISDTKGVSLYYTGDSGFDTGMYEELYRRYGAPAIAMLPVGAYEPRWFMKYSHMNPDEAIEAYKILKAKRAIGFHHETFQLTDEPFDAPRVRTEMLKEKHNIRGQDFLVPYPGDSQTIDL